MSSPCLQSPGPYLLCACPHFTQSASFTSSNLLLRASCLAVHMPAKAVPVRCLHLIPLAVACLPCVCACAGLTSASRLQGYYQEAGDCTAICISNAVIHLPLLAACSCTPYMALSTVLAASLLPSLIACLAQMLGGASAG